MRGMAIIAIALHNFCHWIPGTVRQNESEFLAENVRGMAASDCFASWQGVCDMLSFFGWYGVPVFIFLTGYGLVMKYERDRAPFRPRRFLKAGWLKLANLMIPGLLALIVTTWVTAALAGHLGATWTLRYLSQLTMIPDLVFPWYPPVPGVYWYFGLTMQLYVIYAVAIHRRPAWWLWALVALSIGLQWAVDPGSWTLTWIRHNFTGWMPVVAMGIVWGRTRSVRRSVLTAIALMSALIFLPSMLNPYTWQLSILSAVFIVFVVARVSLHIPGWSRVWIWIGRMSPFIFAAHPVVRMWFFAADSQPVPSPWLLALYLAGVILIAIAYRAAWRLTSRLLPPNL